MNRSTACSNACPRRKWRGTNDTSVTATRRRRVLKQRRPLRVLRELGKVPPKGRKGILWTDEKDDCVCAPTLLCGRVECVRNRKRLYLSRGYTARLGVCAPESHSHVYLVREKRKNRRVALFKYRSHTLAGCVLAGNEISTARLGRFLMPNRKRKAPVWCANKTPASTSSRKGSLVNSL